MINQTSNIVENIVYWDGDINTWQPPENHLMLIQADVIAQVWEAIITDGKITDWILANQLGAGQIGFTWNGSVLTTNQPKPSIPA